MLQFDFWLHVGCGFLDRIFPLCNQENGGNESRDLRTGRKIDWHCEYLIMAINSQIQTEIRSDSESISDCPVGSC